MRRRSSRVGRGVRGACAALLAVAIVSAAAPTWGLMPCRPPPAAELVWPGWSEPQVEIEADAHLLLRLHVPAATVRAWLAPAKGAARQLSLRLERVPELGLYRARATTPIPAGRYELWVRAPERQRFGPPSGTGEQRERRLSPLISVVRRRTGVTAPRLPKPRLRFSRWGEADNDMRRLRRAGRDVSLLFGGGGGPGGPAFVVVRGAYSDGQEQHEVLEVQPYARQVLIGSTASARCASRTPILTPAPKQGRYELTITPWSAAGVKGEPVLLSGRIR